MRKKYNFNIYLPKGLPPPKIFEKMSSKPPKHSPHGLKEIFQIFVKILIINSYNNYAVLFLFIQKHPNRFTFSFHGESLKVK